MEIKGKTPPLGAIPEWMFFDERINGIIRDMKISADLAYRENDASGFINIIELCDTLKSIARFEMQRPRFKR